MKQHLPRNDTLKSNRTTPTIISTKMPSIIEFVYFINFLKIMFPPKVDRPIKQLYRNLLHRYLETMHAPDKSGFCLTTSGKQTCNNDNFISSGSDSGFVKNISIFGINLGICGKSRAYKLMRENMGSEWKAVTAFFYLKFAALETKFDLAKFIIKKTDFTNQLKEIDYTVEEVEEWVSTCDNTCSGRSECETGCMGTGILRVYYKQVSESSRVQ